MASGWKDQMPEMIFVIHNGYEVRYYTTIETFAAAITDGYANKAEAKCFVPADWADDKIDQAVLSIAKRKPHTPRQDPNWNAVMSPYPRVLSPAQQKYVKDVEKRQRLARKKHKDAIVADLTAALGRKV